jgi:NitT/TauT family transport system permease protein
VDWITLARALSISLLYSAGGLLCGVVIAALLIPVSSRWRGAIAGKALAVGLKSVPAFVFPLTFGRLAGPGFLMKVVVSGLICFFPVLVSAQEGLGRVPLSLRRMAEAYGANRARRLFFLEAPWLLVGLIEGIKAAAPLAVVGAVVAEFVDATDASFAGLGTLFSVNRNQPRALAVLSVAATALGCALFLSTALVQRGVKRRLRLVE